MTHNRVHEPHSRVVRIEATPEPITLDLAKTAVLVVDMQHDFGTKVVCLTGRVLICP